jgi:hypothetical protein
VPRRQHRKDRNHDVVRQAVERLGLYWWDAAQTNLGVDGFVVAQGRVVPVEVKDPKARRKLALSPHEAAIHQVLRAHGVTVEILTGDDQSLDVFKAPRRDFYAPTHNR